MSSNSCLLPMQLLFYLEKWYLQGGDSLLGCWLCRALRTPAAANAAATDCSRNHRLFPCRKPGHAQNICYFTSLPSKANSSQMPMNHSVLQDIWASQHKEGARVSCSCCAGHYFASCRVLWGRRRVNFVLCYCLEVQVTLFAWTLPTQWGELSSCNTPETLRHTYWNGASPPPSPSLAVAFKRWMENNDQVPYLAFFSYFLCQTQ